MIKEIDLICDINKVLTNPFMASIFCLFNLEIFDNSEFH
jgi:hypothetical protein